MTCSLNMPITLSNALQQVDPTCSTRCALNNVAMCCIQMLRSACLLTTAIRNNVAICFEHLYGCALNVFEGRHSELLNAVESRLTKLPFRRNLNAHFSKRVSKPLVVELKCVHERD